MIVFRHALCSRVKRQVNLRRNPSNFSLVDKNQYQDNFKYFTVLFTFKAKDINHLLKFHRKQFPMGTRVNKFEVKRNCVNIGKISSSVSFHQYLQVFHTKFNTCSTFGVARSVFILRRYISQSYRSFRWYHVFVHLFLELLVDSVLKKSARISSNKWTKTETIYIVSQTSV